MKGNIFKILQETPKEKFYISKKGSDGILRRKVERNIKMNERLEYLFEKNNETKLKKIKTYKKSIEVELFQMPLQACV